MKNLCVFLLALLLFACFDESSVTQAYREKEYDPDFGWRKGDFIPVLDESKSFGGLKSIYHVGDRIVLVDDYWSSNEYTSLEPGTNTPRVFASKIGSTHWDALVSSEWIRYVYGDSTGLYAGTQLSGKVLKYDFDRSTWDVIYAHPFDSLGLYNVYGIAIYQGRPVVCLAGFEDRTDKRNETIKLAMKMQTDTGWVDITYNYDSPKENPMQFHKGVELNGKLYTISGARGMWRYDGSWKKMAKYPYPSWATWLDENDTTEGIMDIVVHKNKIYVIGQYSSTSILEYDESLDLWNPIDSVIETYDETIDTTDPFADPYRGHRVYKSGPFNRFSLAPDGKHLFVAGSNAAPYVYMGDYGEPYGNEEKGWRWVFGNLCSHLSCLVRDASFDMVAVGDTLYVANWEALLKFPLKDLDEAISDQESYPSIE